MWNFTIYAASNNVAGGLQGWPALQIQLLQELVVAARRMGHTALATRHMTFLLQTMWEHLLPTEQRDLALQLQVLAAQCEGAPVPLVLNSGIVIPPANLTNLPQIRYCFLICTVLCIYLDDLTWVECGWWFISDAIC